MKDASLSAWTLCFQRLDFVRNSPFAGQFAPRTLQRGDKLGIAGSLRGAATNNWHLCRYRHSQKHLTTAEIDSSTRVLLVEFGMVDANKLRRKRRRTGPDLRHHGRRHSSSLDDTIPA